MERDKAVEPRTPGAGLWGIEDETEPTSPRLASGTREIAPIVVTSDGAHRDLSHQEVARIVHDFKGPLATIDLEVELLAEAGVAQTTIDRIRRNVAFLDRMTMDLLDRCMLETGRFQLQRVQIDLRAMLETVIERIVPTRDHGRVFVHAVENALIDADDLRVERVIANLLHNALRYAPAGTEIVVSLDIEPALVRVSVIDAGSELSPAEIAGVFDEYRPRSRRSAREGTGIGLFLSKQIIEAHGGRIGVDCRAGEGTRFYFELPTTS